MNETPNEVEARLAPRWLSPVQEHHIDFLLEEEFAANPKFLMFVLEAAAEHFQSPSVAGPPAASSEPNCSSVRSVTTDKGETDVLVVYQSTEGYGRVAILIEDKIRAGFQTAQAERYHIRGEAGKSLGEWDHFWTCLIAPQQYAQDNRGFDSRISLETLSTFFCGEDARSRFKAQVLDRALKRFAQTGLQKRDDIVTQFRGFYADAAESFFQPGEILWPRARDAWDGDTWFNFRGGPLPRNVEIVHKAPAGCVDMAFRNTAKEALEDALAQCASKSGIAAVQTGKSASLRLTVEKLTEFEHCDPARPIVQEALQSVRRLINFYQTNAECIHKALNGFADIRSQDTP